MAIRNGNSGNNTLIGTSSADTITGFAGNDLLDGKAGVDLLIGGLGNDTYIVDNMGDVVQEQFGEGYDTVKSSVSYTSGVSVERIILTGSANIEASGAPGNGNQTLIGNTGNNNLFGSWGHDVLRGGAGNDIVYGGNNIGLGTEDNLYGDSGNDQLFGELGNDLLDGGSGRDSMNGGDGNDTYYVDNVGDKVNEFVGEGTDSIFSSISLDLDAIGIDAGRNFSDNLYLLGSSHLRGYGNALDNKIAGNAGNNLLDGRGGNDTLIGGKGNDTYVVDSGGDRVAENASSGTDLVQSSITWTLDANVENLFLTGAAVGGYGNALNNSITGNIGNNLLSGEAGADTMSGKAGDDLYLVDNALDKIIEGVNEGFDTVGSSVNYSLGANVEVLILTGGAFKGTGNAINNSIIGTTGHNALYGLAGNDTLDGGDGHDSLDGGTGDDALIGGLGNDIFIVDSAGDTIFELVGEGDDQVSSSVNYTLGANLEALFLAGTAVNGTGNALDNILYGNALANNLQGLGGNDDLVGSVGKDTMTGGLGNDTYSVDNIGDSTIEAVGEGTDTVFSYVSLTLAENIEVLRLQTTKDINGTGNALANVLSGTQGNNLLKGLAGADTLDGDFGNDTLDGGLGADDMNGGYGNDLFIVDDALDLTHESVGAGIDTVKTTIDWTLALQVENLILDIGAVNGTGNTLNNRITGNAADNTLNGLDGADTMSGGLGNDGYYVDHAGDKVVEAANGGADGVFSSVSHVLAAYVENLQLTGPADINGTGNSSNNSIGGTAGDNVLKGMAGNDTLYGLAGEDSLIGGDGNDVLVANDVGVDRLEGGLGNDIYQLTSLDVAIELANQGTDTVTAFSNWTLGANFENLQLANGGVFSGTGNGLTNKITGNEANNTLSGLGGNDTLTGNAGDDRIVGGAGNDLLYGNDSVSGGVDLDTFVFDTVLGSTNVDTIKHFISGSDSIELDSDIFFALDAGALSADHFVVGTAATTVEQHIIYNQTTGSLYYDADGVGAQAAVKFAQLGAGTALLYSDIDVAN